MAIYKTTTVADLRRALDDLEASWTDQDREVLGEFDHQGVVVPHWCRHSDFPEGARAFCGYGPVQMYYDATGVGFIMDSAEPE